MEVASCLYLQVLTGNLIYQNVEQDSKMKDLFLLA